MLLLFLFYEQISWTALALIRFDYEELIYSNTIASSISKIKRIKTRKLKAGCSAFQCRL